MQNMTVRAHGRPFPPKTNTAGMTGNTGGPMLYGEEGKPFRSHEQRCKETRPKAHTWRQC